MKANPLQSMDTLPRTDMKPGKIGAKGDDTFEALLGKSDGQPGVTDTGARNSHKSFRSGDLERVVHPQDEITDSKNADADNLTEDPKRPENKHALKLENLLPSELHDEALPGQDLNIQLLGSIGNQSSTIGFPGPKPRVGQAHATSDIPFSFAAANGLEKPHANSTDLNANGL